MLALDTNILIAMQKREPEADSRYVAALAAGEVLAVPSVVRYEARRSLLAPLYSRRLHVLDNLLTFLPSLDFDQQAADIAASIYHQLRSTGQLIDEADMMIATTAVRYNATLVTRNTSHFQRIQGLGLLDWL
ncbi:PIN domain-containing protein [Deinococcus sp.]|uniref:PIN domain-containing protein n=1 Tax=Deinococcus sp. TaxID=47478 RepID=UPI0025BF5A44|nr:PIN domain-containing protein [Deinococcus sp.]